MQITRQKHGRRSYLSVVIGSDSQSLLERETTRSKDRGLLSYNYTRWLPGFGRVPNYEPSPCHMHPFYIIAIIRRITMQSLYTRNTKVAMARAALCVVLWAHGCILYTGQCPPQGTSLEVSLLPYLAASRAPIVLLSLASLLPPSSARFFPPLFPSLCPCLRSFLTRCLPQTSLPSSTPAPTLPHIITSSRSPVAPPPILHPASLLPCLPPCLSACLRRPIQCTQCVVFGHLH